MTSNQRNITTLFKEWYGNHIDECHCLAYRLELAVEDALKSVTATYHFQSFLILLYAVYSQSPTIQRELHVSEIATETETKLLRITAIFDIQ